MCLYFSIIFLTGCKRGVSGFNCLSSPPRASPLNLCPVTCEGSAYDKLVLSQAGPDFAFATKQEHLVAAVKANAKHWENVKTI